MQFIRDNGFTAWQFLLAINVMLIILGMFLEVASILLIAMPIIIPVLKPLGIDPVHFAIVVTVNMELALITAPVGLNLYVLATVSKTPIATVIKGVNPVPGAPARAAAPDHLRSGDQPLVASTGLWIVRVPG